MCKDIEKLREDIKKSAEKLLSSSVGAVPSGLSAAIIEGVECYTWSGYYITARIYKATEGGFLGEIILGDSVKLVKANTAAELRNVAFWVDKCLARFVKDRVIAIFDNEDTPF